MQLQACNQKMADLTTAMGDIAQSSRQISGIIKTIDDISFQTNILALNAAVEAKPQGQGKREKALPWLPTRSRALPTKAPWLPRISPL